MIIKTYKTLIFLLTICLFIGCSDDKEETLIVKNIDGKALVAIDGVSTGKYYITKALP